MDAVAPLLALGRAANRSHAIERVADGVEDDAMIQHERAVNFDFRYCSADGRVSHAFEVTLATREQGSLTACCWRTPVPKS